MEGLAECKRQVVVVRAAVCRSCKMRLGDRRKKVEVWLFVWVGRQPDASSFDPASVHVVAETEKVFPLEKILVVVGSLIPAGCNALETIEV